MVSGVKPYTKRQMKARIAELEEKLIEKENQAITDREAAGDRNSEHWAVREECAEALKSYREVIEDHTDAEDPILRQIESKIREGNPGALVILNPIAQAGPMALNMSPNMAVAWDMIAEDFKAPIAQMFLTLLSNVPEKGIGWRDYLDDDAIEFYLARLKEEIEEFEKDPSVKEAADVANFGMMLVYAVQKRKKVKRNHERSVRGLADEPLCNHVPSGHNAKELLDSLPDGHPLKDDRAVSRRIIAVEQVSSCPYHEPDALRTNDEGEEEMYCACNYFAPPKDCNCCCSAPPDDCPLDKEVA